MASDGPLNSTLIEDGNVDDSVLKDASDWLLYSEAAVKRQQELVSLNRRLRRLLTFANDVGPVRHNQRSNSYSHFRSERSVPESEASSSSRLRSRSKEALTVNPFEAEEVEPTIDKKARIIQKSVDLCDVRIDFVRRAMSSFSQKNAELMRENGELRILNAETEAELQRLKDGNDRLRVKNRHLKISSASRLTDHRACQESMRSLRLENRDLKARLAQHKQSLRRGLDDFISRSVEALQNGTPILTDHEKHAYPRDSGDDEEQTAIRKERLTLSDRSDVVPKEQVAQLQEELQSLTDELEHERFCSKRKINRLQEMSDQLRENLTRKEEELQKAIGELDTLLGVLQALISTGDGTQEELDVYRQLVEEEESRLLESSADTSGCSSFGSVLSFRSRNSSTEGDWTNNSQSLEIERQDIRRGKFIVLQNKGDESLDMSRWHIVHQCGDQKVTHQLPSPFIIKPKSRVLVWSADAKATHLSPMNYTMEDTVLPWCESGETDLITKVYDLLGNVVARRVTRISRPGMLDDSDERNHCGENDSCTLS